MKQIRVFIAALFAMAVTFGLFLLMHQLISSGGGDRADLAAIAGIHFGPIDIPVEIATKSRTKPRRPPPRKVPPPPRLQISRADQRVQSMPRIDIPNLDVPLVWGGGMFLGNFQQVDRTAEGDIIPIVIIRPLYPRDAAISGIEGWVKIEFTITAVGTVIDARPAGVFNREAIRAILKWKFKPRVVGGVAVERQATQVIDFALDDAEGS
jgi:protein TonB